MTSSFCAVAPECGRPAGRHDLTPSLRDALDLVMVSDNRMSARVAARQVRAASPAELPERLARAIYEVLHTGHGASARAGPTAWRDEAFEARLLAATPLLEVTRTVRALAGGEQHVRVELEGVRVRLERSQVEVQPGQPIEEGALLPARVPAVRPALSPGFFAAEGTLPAQRDEPVLRVYLHLRTPAAAVAAWAAMLGALEERRIVYRAKVISLADLLPRRDALVVYLGERDHEAAKALASLVSGMSGVGKSVSFFAERVRPGVAIAWEPADRRSTMQGLSFGEHRARAVADGLIRYAASGGACCVASAVRRALLDANIDPANPARNAVTL
jgi:HopA1 effector protein family